MRSSNIGSVCYSRHRLVVQYLLRERLTNKRNGVSVVAQTKVKTYECLIWSFYVIFLLKASNDWGRRLFLAPPLERRPRQFLVWRLVLCKSSSIADYTAVDLNAKEDESTLRLQFCLEIFLYQSHFNIYLIPINCIRKSIITWWLIAPLLFNFIRPHKMKKERWWLYCYINCTFEEEGKYS